MTGFCVFIQMKDVTLDVTFSLSLLVRFANSLPINDPLQTVYQLMSGRMPASATVSAALAFFLPCCYSEEVILAVFSGMQSCMSLLSL